VDPSGNEEEGCFGPIGSGIPLDNTLLVCEAQVNEVSNTVLTFGGKAQVEAGDLVSPLVDDGDVARLGDVEDNGLKDSTRQSELSESTSDAPQEVEKSKAKKGPKKPQTNPARPLPQQLGVPKFCQLAESMKEAGKRRKEAKKKKSREGDVQNEGVVTKVGVMCNHSSQPHALSTMQDSVEPPVIGLHVVLPLPPSGLTLVMDDHGESMPDSISDTDDGAVRREEEANILIGIQKQVGFTFDGDEDEIQSKLVELETHDNEKKVVREQESSGP
jgi:hypothetical protein